MGTSTQLSSAGEDTFSPAMAQASRYMEWVISIFREHIHGRVLEVGLGHGSYYPLLSRLGDEYVGMELDESLVDLAKRKFPTGRFVQGDLTTASASGLGNFDTIICFNVLEHIEDDEEAVRGMSRMLTDEGRICLFVPAFPLLYNDMDRLAGHYRRYTRASLRTLADKAGTHVDRLTYFNFIGGCGWLANNLIRHNSLKGNAVNSQIALFDRYLVGPAKLVDPIGRAFFGQSLVAVLSRRDLGQ